MDVQTEIETAVIYHIIVGDVSSGLYGTETGSSPRSLHSLKLDIGRMTRNLRSPELFFHIFPRTVGHSLVATLNAWLMTSQTRRSNHQIRRVTLMLTLTLFALFAFTTVYTGVNILWSKQEILAWSRISGQGLSSLYKTCNCVKTATLTINVCVIFSS